MLASTAPLAVWKPETCAATGTATASKTKNDRLKEHNVRVVVRVRPMNDKESHCKECVSVNETCTPQAENRHNTQEGTVVTTPVAKASSTPSKLKCNSASPSPLRQRRQSLIPSTRKSGLKSPSLTSLPKPGKQQSLAGIDTTPAKASNDTTLSLQSLPTSLTVHSSANNGTPREFQFDGVFPPFCSQEQLYHLSVGDSVLQNIFKGYNSTILAYGQTGSGKTYTMGPHSDGIVPRAVADLFRGCIVNEQNWDISVALSCLELLQEEFRDLLVAEGCGSSDIKLRNLGSSGVVVEGPTLIRVHSVEQAMELLRLAATRRATSSTQRNEQSSRSHAIYSFLVSMQPRSGNSADALSSKLTLVDLAGSEQLKKSGVQGNQAKESININKDLFVLGKVVSALADKGSSSSVSNHVPYRDSKLTQILQDSLGGNCCTLLIACVSPADTQADESINTLRYAERSRSISNLVQKNSLRTVLLTASESEALRAENERLKRELEKLRQSQSFPRLSADKAVSKGRQQQFEELQSKLRQAEAQARMTRESCLTVATFADKWRDRCEFQESIAKTASLTDSEASLKGTIPGDTTGRCRSSMKLSLETGGPLYSPPISIVAERRHKDEQKDDMAGSFAGETRSVMVEELDSLSNQIQEKRSELNRLHDEFGTVLETVKQEVSVEEQKRDNLAKEVNQMKLKIHLLSTEVKEDSGDSQPDLQSIFRRTFSDEASERNQELKTTKSFSDAMSQGEETISQITVLEQQVEEERVRADEIITKIDGFQREVDELTGENIRLTELNQQLVTSSEENHRKEAERILKLEEENERLRREALRANALKKEACEKTLQLREEVTSLRESFERLVAETSGKERCGDAIVELDNSSQYSAMSSLASTTVGAAHAAKILSALGQAYKNSNNNSQLSLPSSDAVKLSMTSPKRACSPVSDICGPLSANATGKEVLISNLSNLNQIPDIGTACSCESTRIFGNVEHADFYLPKVGIHCACGKRTVNVSTGSDPCSLQNVLRDWQTDFLASIAIFSARDFITACEERGRGAIAKQMRRWRKKQNMTLMRTQACAIALHIWWRTCAVVVKTVEEQTAKGITVPARPDFLEICVMSDTQSMSTLDMGSVHLRRSIVNGSS